MRDGGRRIQRRTRRGIVLPTVLMLLLFLTVKATILEGECVEAANQRVDAETTGVPESSTNPKSEAPSASDEVSDMPDTTASDLLSNMDFTEVQDMLDGMLGEGSFSFRDTVESLLKGEETSSKETVLDFLRGLLFSGLNREKALLSKIILLILLAAVFANFASVFENGQVGDLCFYMVYLLLFMLLMDSFLQMSMELQEVISQMTDVTRALAPAYFLAAAASSGTATAAVFYEGVLVLVWLIQWVLLTILLPGTNLYVLLRLVNHLSREEMLGKLAELLKTGISWGLRTLLGAAAGLQIVRGLIAPVMDSLKRSVIGKAASALPGVGNAVNMVTELVLTSAVLVRNCLGVAVLIIFVLAGAGPVIHYGILSLGYRFLAAAAQPVSDKRMVECLSTMGEGYAFLMKLLFTAEVLCMLAFLVIMAWL